ncbi:MAG TPA: amidohydrolase family protein [Acidimicrobiia bacterium]|nr:amidohydrolase family protein [Acidimicrobiia bacterium]
MPYDLVVRNGTVVDGTGAPRFRADVGVVGDRIAALGRIRERGAHEMDAEGRFVTPGFVDGHTHMDAQVFWDPLGTCSCWHGVTTVVMGNCGFTLAPCRETEKDLAIRSLERAEDIARDAMLEGITWQWETYADYLDALARTPLGINYAGYIGHSALRTYVMGERAFEQTATDDDLTAMRREVESALRAGAIGFSTSRSPNHETADDRPVASRLASWSEVEALVDVMTGLGAGVFELAQEQPLDPDTRADYARRLRDLAVTSGRPITYVVGMSPAAPDAWRDALDLLDDIAARGGRVTGQVHSREFLSIIGFKVNLPFDRLPGWAEMRSRPLAEQRAALADPARRAALVAEAHAGRYGAAIGAEVRPPQYDAIRVLDAPEGPYRTVAEVAAERRADPVDVMIDLSLERDLALFFAQPFANQDLGAVRTMLEHPRTVVAISDSGAHVSQIIDASVPTHFLSHWVRAEQVFTWEQGVRKLTSDPARLWGFADRGVVAEGYAADLTVFDPGTIAPALPDAARDLPAGALRLTQRATGIDATVVNGRVLLVDGEPTGDLPGRLLRGRLA